MQLDPRARVDQQRERQRVRLGEPEVRERLDLGVDRVGLLPHEPVLGHAGVQLLFQRVDALHPALGPHRPPQQVGVLAGEPADGHAHLHELLLEHRDAERALEHRHELGVGVGHLLLPELALDERVHGPALDGAGADQRDLDHEVVEPPGLQARQQAHLRARLDLEHADRVGAAQHVVDRLLLLRDGRQLPVVPRRGADHVEAVLQGRQHPESQQVELDQPHPGGVVLVPLDHRAVLHAGVLDRHDLAHRPVGEHHAAGVDAEMPRRLEQLGRELEHLIGDVVAGARLEQSAPPLDLLGPGILLPRRMPQRLGHVAHGVLGPVLDDVRDLRGAIAPVLLVDPLDDLFPTIGVEVDVDVGLLFAQARQEPLEGQVVADRVDRRDVEQIADGTVGRGPATLTQDAAAPRLLHDAVDDQEVARKVLQLDDAELLLDARPVRLRSGADTCAAPHPTRACAATTSACAPRAPSASAARAWPCAAGRRARRRASRCGPRHPGTARTAPPSRHPTAGAPRRARAASRRARRARGWPAPPRPPRRAAAAAARRSARCSSRAAAARARARARRARRSSRVSSGLPWSMSSTCTASRPNSVTRRSSSWAAASAPAFPGAEASARRTAPLRHPVSTAQCPGRPARRALRGRRPDAPSRPPAAARA